MSPVRMNEAEMALRAGMAFVDAFNRRDTAAIQALLAPDCRYAPYDLPPDSAPLTGRAAVMEWFTDLFARYPESSLRAENAFGFGKRCIIYWSFQSGENKLIRGVDIVEADNWLITSLNSFVKASA